MNGTKLFQAVVEVRRAEGQEFTLSQFRSPAYNFNVRVTRSENINRGADLKRAAVNS